MAEGRSSFFEDKIDALQSSLQIFLHMALVAVTSAFLGGLGGLGGMKITQVNLQSEKGAEKLLDKMNEIEKLHKYQLGQLQKMTQLLPAQNKVVQKHMEMIAGTRFRYTNSDSGLTHSTNRKCTHGETS